MYTMESAKAFALIDIVSALTIYSKANLFAITRELSANTGNIDPEVIKICINVIEQVHDLKE